MKWFVGAVAVAGAAFTGLIVGFTLGEIYALKKVEDALDDLDNSTTKDPIEWEREQCVRRVVREERRTTPFAG